MPSIADGEKSEAGMRVANRILFRTTLLAGAAALTIGCDIAKDTSRNLEATADASPRTPAKPRPIPAAGPLAEPKSLKQVGVPVDATRAAVPAGNPQTPEKIALGQKLFFDGRLSVDGTVACSTCHDPARAFTERRPVSIGVKGRVGQRNAPTILNALYDKTQFWDGRVKTLEDQVASSLRRRLRRNRGCQTKEKRSKIGRSRHRIDGLTYTIALVEMFLPPFLLDAL
jgi:hypothetical protein